MRSIIEQYLQLRKYAPTTRGSWIGYQPRVRPLYVVNKPKQTRGWYTNLKKRPVSPISHTNLRILNSLNFPRR